MRVTVDGTKLVSGVDYGTQLTFADSTDLEYFQPGDAVSYGSVTVNTSSGTFDNGKTPNKLFDIGDYCADNNPGQNPCRYPMVRSSV